MEIVTIYGNLMGSCITSGETTYQLDKHCGVFDPVVGWFHITKMDDKWRLLRMLKESRAEIYPNWTDELRLISLGDS